MSAPGRTSVDPKALLQELKTNRKTQAALGIMVLVLGYSIYSLLSSKPKSRSGGAIRTFAVANSGDRQFAALQKLPNLSQLSQAGELPGEDRMYRDLVVFDMPAPKPIPVKPMPTPPPPPPPTPEQIAAEQLRQSRDAEMNARPQSLRYLGYMGTATSGRLGDFLKGEEPVTIRLGDLANPQWRLVSITETHAEFQNLKYPELRHRIESNDSRSNNSNTPSNEY